MDETDDLKKGKQPEGVQRQYTGTAGRIENAQLAAYPVYASDAGHAMTDRELYVPQGWIQDPDRCRAAGIPEQVCFATKPALARAMIGRALDAGVPAAWVTGDEAHGADPTLRAELEGRGIGSLLAVACDHRVLAGGDSWRADGPAREGSGTGLAVGVRRPRRQGHRYDHWAFIRLDDGDRRSPGGQAQRWLLVRRDPKSVVLAFYHCWTPRPVSLATWSGSPGALDHRGALPDRQRPGRPGPAPGPPLAPLYRWTTLAMLAHALLVVLAATDHTQHPPPARLISLTCNEVQHLLATRLVRPTGA